MENNRVNIFSRSYVINTLKLIEAKPLKKLGQNFLIDKNVVENIVSIIPKNSYLIEIGPGLGHMRLLQERVKRYVGIEIDKKLSLFLIKEGFNIIHSDFLKVDLRELTTEDCIIFGNIPYYITTQIITHIIRNINRNIKSLIFLVQKDFAKKLRDNKIKTASLVLIRYHFEILPPLFEVSKNSFYPVPNVDSVVIKLNNKGVDYERGYEEFLRLIFKHKRKSVQKILKERCKSNDLRLKEYQRVEDIDDFYGFYKELNSLLS